jgi:nitrite reductase/ring-hydroxylating ferredoxin subunit
VSKKKQGGAARKAPVPVKKKGVSTATWIVGAVAALALVAVIVIVSSGSSGATATTSTADASNASAAGGAVPADEQKYIGRLLPATFTEPSVAPASAYSSAIKQTDVTPTQDKKQLTLALSDVVSNKIVYFEYKKAGGDPIAMIAYVKPSGKLFVGVGYCIPCKGTRQRIESDGTLTCEACGTKRDLETGVGISGTCRLYPLDEVPAKVIGGKIVVQSSVLEKWTAQPLDRKVGA